MYKEGAEISLLVTKFIRDLQPMIEWCLYNRLDINWSKTFFMITTNKRDLNFPEKILIGDIAVKVVDKFKLLGVTIDNKLNYAKFKYSFSVNFFPRPIGLCLRIMYFKKFL